MLNARTPAWMIRYLRLILTLRIKVAIVLYNGGRYPILLNRCRGVIVHHNDIKRRAALEYQLDFTNGWLICLTARPTIVCVSDTLNIESKGTHLLQFNCERPISSTNCSC